MSTLQELLPYLERGFTLQSVRGETLRLQSGSRWVEWHKSAGYRFQSEPEKYSLGQLSSMGDMWSWGVAFTADGKHVFIETEIAHIDELIARGIPGVAYEQKG